MKMHLQETVVALVLLVLPASARGQELPAASAKTAAQATPGHYTVARGDTLSAIARAHGVPLAALERANPQIKDFDRIFPGDRILLPSASDLTPPTAPATRPRTVAPRASSPPVTAKRATRSAPVTTPGSARPPSSSARAGDGRGSAAGSAAIEAIESGELVNSNPKAKGPHDWSSWCLALVRTAFKKATGRDIPELTNKVGAWDAYKAFEREGLVQHGAPPRGAIVFWSPEERARKQPGSKGAIYGHVALSNGDGTVVSNTRAGIHSVPIATFGEPAGYVLLDK